MNDSYSILQQTHFPVIVLLNYRSEITFHYSYIPNMLIVLTAPIRFADMS
jgi:hypothetical protein